MPPLENKLLHIISFDIPSPPDYGGAIDVYFKVKALSEAGVGVIFHAYQYKGREISEELKGMCREVYTYKRKMDWTQAIGTTPFIMASRDSGKLIKRLELDKYPVLMEGMHTGIHLGHPVLNGRIVLLRMHNVEWTYYRELSRNEKAIFRKLYYYIESLRLDMNRKVLRKADRVLAISRSEKRTLEQELNNVSYLPAFHANNAVNSRNGRGDFALYHGNLSVPENRNAAEWLVEEVFDTLNVPLKIAGSNPPADMEHKWANKNVEVVANPDNELMNELLSDAQLHVLPTFQSTGVKLKLLNALYNGRHVLVTPEMVTGSGLEDICHIAESAVAMKKLIGELWPTEFTQEEKGRRSIILNREYNNTVNASKLIGWLYPHP